MSARAPRARVASETGLVRSVLCSRCVRTRCPPASARLGSARLGFPRIASPCLGSAARTGAGARVMPSVAIIRCQCIRARAHPPNHPSDPTFLAGSFCGGGSIRWAVVRVRVWFCEHGTARVAARVALEGRCACDGCYLAATCRSEGTGAVSICGYASLVYVGVQVAKVLPPLAEKRLLCVAPKWRSRPSLPTDRPRC